MNAEHGNHRNKPEKKYSKITVNNKQYWLMSARDITDRKRAEKALEESERKLYDIIEFLPDATFVIDLKDKVIAWNRAMEEMTGISKKDMIGKGNHVYTIPFYGKRRQHLMDLIDRDDAEIETKYQNVQRKGHTLYAEAFTPALYGGKGAHVWATAAPLFDAHGIRVGAIESIRDITDRKQAEDALRDSLQEKEVLIREVHHRVKNNMQIMSSLLQLQSNEVKDDTVRRFFIEATNRIRSMAIVHEKLYNTNNLATIDFTEYIKDLINQLFRSYGINAAQIRFRLKADKILLNVDDAIPMALILNELVSNSIKHAFPDRKEGEISLRLEERGNNVTMELADNGIGAPDDLRIGKNETLGLQLVQALAKQLGGSMQLGKNNGARFILSFKKK